MITFNYSSPSRIVAQEKQYEATLKAQKRLTQQLEDLEGTLKFADSNRVFKELKESYEKDKKVSVIIYILGIRMRIMCLTRSTWKVQNGEARSAVEMTPCCPPPIPLHGSASEVNSSSADTQVVSCHCYVVNRLPYIWTRSGVVRSAFGNNSTKLYWKVL